MCERKVTIPVYSSLWWKDLRSKSVCELEILGCGQWNDLDNPVEEDEEFFGFGGVLMLFPGVWYSMIPLGFCVIDVHGFEEGFIHGQTLRDVRLGCLQYGIVCKGN